MQMIDIPGRIIFLNGVPNAGKTTLAKTIQRMTEEPYWHLSLDDFLHGYTEENRLRSLETLFARVMHGYLRSLRQLSLCGNNIVAEAVITPDRLGTYLELFGDLPVLLIGLHVPLHEAQRREQQRADRRQPYEVSARDLELVHAHRQYDLELNMDQLSPQEAAQRVLAVVATPPSPTAWERLVTR